MHRPLPAPQSAGSGPAAPVLPFFCNVALQFACANPKASHPPTEQQNRQQDRQDDVPDGKGDALDHQQKTGDPQSQTDEFSGCQIPAQIDHPVYGMLKIRTG